MKEDVSIDDHSHHIADSSPSDIIHSTAKSVRKSAQSFEHILQHRHPPRHYSLHDNTDWLHPALHMDPGVRDCMDRAHHGHGRRQRCGDDVCPAIPRRSRGGLCFSRLRRPPGWLVWTYAALEAHGHLRADQCHRGHVQWISAIRSVHGPEWSTGAQGVEVAVHLRWHHIFAHCDLGLVCHSRLATYDKGFLLDGRSILFSSWVCFSMILL